jgi:hypothetical protein
VYKNKNVAEQNSVALCWDLVAESSFDVLRAAIYSTDDERKHFRQLLVNAVVVTDTMDKELKTLLGPKLVREAGRHHGGSFRTDAAARYSLE